MIRKFQKTLTQWESVRLLKAALPYGWHLLAALLGMWVVAAAEPAVVWAVKYVVDQGLEPTRGSTWLIWIPLGLFLVYLLKGIAGFISGYLMMWVSGKVMAHLQKEVYLRILISDPNVDQQNIGKAINVIAAETRQALDFIERVLIRILRSFFSVVALAVTLIQINTQIALILLTMSVPFVWSVRVMGKKYEAVTKTYVDSNSKLAEASEEALRQAGLIRQYDAAGFESARLDKVSMSVNAAFRKMATVAGSIAPVSQMVVALYLAFFYLLRPHFDDALSNGEFVAMSATIMLLMAPMQNLAMLNAAMLRSLVASAAVFSLLDLPRERSGGVRWLGSRSPKIEFSKVAFFSKNSGALFRDFNLSVGAGEIIALTGNCGSGKSNILRMLCGLRTTDEGAIRVDGICISEIALSDLRAQIAYVGHDNSYFDGSILDNVCYGDPAPDMQRLSMALRGAQLDEIVERLPDGVLTQIGYSAEQLSGGQSQLLSIARALYRDTPIILLDEPSSALDASTQMALAAALKILLIGRTTVIVTHSDALMSIADRIIELKGDSSVMRPRSEPVLHNIDIQPIS